MSKLKNTEMNSVLLDIEEQKRLDTEREEHDYIAHQEELKRQEEEEKAEDFRKKNQLILSVDPNHDAELEGNRRHVYFNDHYDFISDRHHFDVYDERNEGDYVGRLTDTRYQDGVSYTDWGQITSIPSHWSNDQAENYLEMKSEGYQISEKLFDKYIKSGAKDVFSFLNIEKVRSKISKTEKEAEKPSDNSIASIAKIKNLKNTKNKGR